MYCIFGDIDQFVIRQWKFGKVILMECNVVQMNETHADVNSGECCMPFLERLSRGLWWFHTDG